MRARVGFAPGVLQQVRFTCAAMPQAQSRICSRIVTEMIVSQFPMGALGGCCEGRGFLPHNSTFVLLGFCGHGVGRGLRNSAFLLRGRNGYGEDADHNAQIRQQNGHMV